MLLVISVKPLPRAISYTTYRATERRSCMLQAGQVMIASILNTARHFENVVWCQCRVGGKPLTAMKPLRPSSSRASISAASASPPFGFLIFVWPTPHGLVVVGIHDDHNPPTIVLITSDADLDGVLLHVGFIQVDCGTEPIVPGQALPR